MTDKERYYWDLNGHLIVRNVLTPKELKAANDAIDYLADRCANGTDEESDFLRDAAQPRWMGETLTRTRNNIPFLLQLKAPHCDPYRKMIAHPQVISRLRVMCGEGFRFDHGPITSVDFPASRTTIFTDPANPTSLTWPTRTRTEYPMSVA